MIELGHFKADPLARDLIKLALDTNRLSYGPLSKRFERLWGNLHNTNPVFVNSGTSALQLAIQAMAIERDWRPGSEIIVPAITFVATINAVLHNNFCPVVVDVDDKMGMDPQEFYEALSDKTVAVIPVHILGRPCDMTAILEVAHREGIAVIEDSCEAVGARCGEDSVGDMGDCSAFSTYAAHPIVTGVGGFACSGNEETAGLIRSLANHGRDQRYMSIDDVGDEKTRWEIATSRFKFDHIGHSYRATELEAAIGIAQMEQWHNIAAARRQIGFALDEALGQDFMVGYNPGDFVVPMNYPISAGGRKEKLVHALESDGIQTRDIVSVLDQPCYDNEPRILWGYTPNAKRIYDETLYIGCHQGMTSEDVARIASIVKGG